jgi:CHAT domain
MVERCCLIVSSDSTAREVIFLAIQDAFPDDKTVFVPAATEADALSLHEKRRSLDLVVTDLVLAVDRNTPAVRSERRGMHLLEALEARQLEVPEVLLYDVIDDEINRFVNARSQRRAVSRGVHFAEDFKNAVTRVTIDPSVAGNRPCEQRCKAIVRIVIGSEAKSFCIRFRDAVDIAEPEGSFQMSADAIERLRDQADWLRRNLDCDYKDWKKQLAWSGEDLFRELSRNPEFAKWFSEARCAAGGLENMHFQFHTDRAHHPIILEAIKEPKEEFWTLASPFCRRLMAGPRRYRLPWDLKTLNRPLNCLVIKADVEGAVPSDWNSGPEKLEKLGELENECDYIERLAEGLDSPPRPRAHRARINVERINSNELRPAKFLETVRTALTSRQGDWDIVHFAGHSWHDDDSRRGFGCVFFPDDPPRLVQKIDIETFADWLQGAGLIYLSSCRSSGEEIVYTLAEHHLPAIVGFRWNIDDAAAALHAKAFYEGLLQEALPLERAFVRARRALYQERPEDRSWAAPMLIVQPPAFAETELLRRTE